MFIVYSIILKTSLIVEVCFIFHFRDKNKKTTPIEQHTCEIFAPLFAFLAVHALAQSELPTDTKIFHSTAEPFEKANPERDARLGLKQRT